MKKPKSEFDIHSFIHSFNYWELHILEWKQNLSKAHRLNNHMKYTYFIWMQVKTVYHFTHNKKNNTEKNQ